MAELKTYIIIFSYLMILAIIVFILILIQAFTNNFVDIEYLSIVFSILVLFISIVTFPFSAKIREYRSMKQLKQREEE